MAWDGMGLDGMGVQYRGRIIMGLYFNVVCVVY